MKIGLELFKKMENTDKNRPKATTRRLAHIFMKFRHLLKKDNVNVHLRDMFNRKYLSAFHDSIRSLTTNEIGEVCHSMRITYGHDIRRSVDILINVNLIENKDSTSDELEKYLRIFNHSWSYNFKASEDRVVQKRNAVSRKPENLASNLLVQKCINFCENYITQRQNVEISNFVKIRNCLLTVLTFDNGRRGGEVARLKISHVAEALKDEWQNKNT